MTTRKVFLLFLDGVGIGSSRPERNPFFRARMPAMRSLLGGELPHLRDRRRSTSHAEVFPVSATLRMPGLPQSGTGQAAIFTGVNAARVFGRHFGPYPPTALKPVIEERSLFRRVVASGRSAILVNAFPRRFFEYTASGTRRLSVTTLAAMTAGLPLLDADALLRNTAVSADMRRERWKELGHPDVEPISVTEAGRHCADLVHAHDLSVFDYWLPDHAGHAQDMSQAVRVLETLDTFLGELVDRVNLDETLILSISDHGNVEDLSTKMHTRNPVPGLAIGQGRQHAARTITSLTHVTPFILDCLNLPH